MLNTRHALTAIAVLMTLVFSAAAPSPDDEVSATEAAAVAEAGAAAMEAASAAAAAAVAAAASGMRPEDHFQPRATEPVPYHPAYPGQLRDNMPLAGPISGGGTSVQGGGELIRAAQLGEADAIDALAASGVADGSSDAFDVNKRDRDGWTALMHASAEGHVAAVRSLLALGANANRGRDLHDGWNALLHASSNNAVTVVRLLLEAGADVDHKDVQKWTALMHAASSCHTEVVRELIRGNANTEAADSNGRTALMEALAYEGADKRDTTVRILLEGGARAGARDAWGTSTAQQAKAMGHTELAQKLAELARAQQEADPHSAVNADEVGPAPPNFDEPAPVRNLWARRAELGAMRATVEDIRAALSEAGGHGGKAAKLLRKRARAIEAAHDEL